MYFAVALPFLEFCVGDPQMSLQELLVPELFLFTTRVLTFSCKTKQI
jgi:hypothetical protein